MQRGENVPKGPRMIKHQLKADMKAGASGEGTIHGSEDQEFGDSLRDCLGQLLKSNKGKDRQTMCSTSCPRKRLTCDEGSRKLCVTSTV